MSPDSEFYLKILGCFLLSGVLVKIMNIRQKHIEAEAEKQYQRTMKLIDLRCKLRENKEKNDSL